MSWLVLWRVLSKGSLSEWLKEAAAAAVMPEVSGKDEQVAEIQILEFIQKAESTEIPGSKPYYSKGSSERN